MTARNDMELMPELSLDDLDKVAGGAVIRYARYGRMRAIEYSCP